MFNYLSNTDYISIGSCPHEEDSAQLNLNESNLTAFHKQNHLECEILMDQMKRTTLKNFKYKDNLFIKKCNYEHSYYEEVCYSFKIDSEAEDMMGTAEDAVPEHWDKESKKKLSKLI